MAITDTWLRNQLGKDIDKPIEVTDRDGLSIRVSKRGVLTFQVRYRHYGKGARITLGTYPAMTLKEARDESIKQRGIIEKALDPREVRKKDQLITKHDKTYSQVFREWYEKVCLKELISPEAVKRTFEIYVLPELGDTSFKELTTMDWVERIEAVAEIYASIADRILGQTKKLYRWAKKRGYVDFNPVLELMPKEDFGIEKGSTDRVLTDQELQWMWQYFRKSRMAKKNKLYIILCLLFGCRSGELRIAKKKEMDLKEGTWFIPYANHKMGTKTKRDIIRPIPDEFKPIIQEAMNLSRSKVWIFTNGDTDKVMGRGSPIQLPYNVMQWVRMNMKQELAGKDVVHWSIHDLRRTNRTRMTPLASREIAEAILGHTIQGVEGVYNRYEYISEMKEAYIKWYEVLDDIVQGVEI